MLLPRMRLRFRIDSLVALSTVVFALVTGALGLLHQFILVLVVLTFGGVAWTAAMSTLNVAAQTTVPGWVQARALGIYMLVFQGAMAVASAVWGEVARRFGLGPTFLLAGAIMLATVIIRLRWGLVDTERLNLARSRHWADPVTALEVDPDHGPVLVTSIYRVEQPEAGPFLRAMREVGRARRRSGAVRWNLFRDVANPNRYIETFLVESWAEHLRQHERTTIMDEALEELAIAFHQETDPPLVEHYIYAYDGEDEDDGMDDDSVSHSSARRLAQAETARD
ncbi:MAG: MFS transporter [Chloroflexi bacterium]|nr:MFS transporter [Chloroflexota bacterium]